jgi:hypothetical protein
MMKKINVIQFNRFIAVIATITALSSFSVMAVKSEKQKYQEMQEKQIEVKCHVEYEGGGEGIQGSVGLYSEPNQAINTLQGLEFDTYNKKNIKVTKVINKVKECVEGDGRFASAKARQLDQNTLR